MLRSEYISATSKYAPDHPDVIRLRREIQGLEKQTGAVDSRTEQAKQLAGLRSELAAASQKYSPDHPDVIRLTKAVAAQEASLKQEPQPELEAAKEKPDNPAYLTLQADLEGLKSQMQTYVTQREQLKAKLDEYEKRLQETPEVERNYLVLTRDYETSGRRYQELMAKQNEAQAGQELEKERKGERFSLIDPAELPEKPVRPNRPAVIILGLLLSVGGGIGFATVAESVDNSVRGARGVMAALQLSPLSVIPYMQNSADIAQAEKTKRIAIAIAVSGIVLLILCIHFFWIPLDVLWFKGLRKVDTTMGG